MARVRSARGLAIVDLGPMVDAARRELAGAGVASKPDVVVADAGYWHLDQINAISADGIPLLIPPDSSRRRKTGARPGWNGGAYDFMRGVLETALGGALYRQRRQLIEPIFGHTKHNRGFTRFHRRRRAAASGTCSGRPPPAKKCGLGLPAVSPCGSASGSVGVSQQTLRRLCGSS